MRKIHIALTLAILAVFGFSPSVRAIDTQNAQNFLIDDFVQVVRLEKDSSNVAVAYIDEYITAIFPDYDQNHGILRALPTKYDDISLKTSLISVDNMPYAEPSNDGAIPYEYNTYIENNNLVVRIGDSDRFVHGKNVYHISYTMKNMIRSYDGHDELFTNVNGDQWYQTIKSVTSKIVISSDTAKLQDQKYACYTGYYGSRSNDCTSSTVVGPDGSLTVTTATTRPLSARENLSVVLGFERGSFTVDQPTFLEKYGILLLNLPFLIAPLAVLIVFVRRWWKYGRDPDIGRSVVAQYQPIEDMDVLRSGMLLKQTSTPTAISAQIIDLAICGYIKIVDTSPNDAKKPKKEDLSFVRQKPGDDLSATQKMVLGMLFKDGDNAELSKLANKLYRDSTSIAKRVDEDMVSEGLYRYQPMKQSAKYYAWSIVLIVVGLGSLVFFAPINLYGLSIGAFVSGLVLMPFAKIMPARTAKGAEYNNHLLGLKLYIGMAEQERIRFHQSLENAKREPISDERSKIVLFERLLPYAILFGLEKSWSKQFENLYTSPPDWYSSSHSLFSATYLTSAMGSVTRASGEMFKAPSSSGNGSGFGGGGFSGGGSGGGGGGGW